MKYLTKTLLVILVLTIAGAALLPLIMSNNGQEKTINQWEMVWVDKLDPSLTAQQLDRLPTWEKASADNPTPNQPSKTAKAAWIRIWLPYGNENSGIILSKLIGKDIRILYNNHFIYQKTHNNPPYSNDVLLPVQLRETEGELYIGISVDHGDIGLFSDVSYGDYNQLLLDYVRRDMSDLILGCSFVFIAVILLLCSFFLIEENIKSWIALSVVILCIGLLVITYSPFLYNFYGNYGTFYFNMFDIALFIFLPAFSYYMEQIFNKGKYVILVRRYRQFQTAYSIFCFVFLMADGRGAGWLYSFLTGTVMGYLMMIQIVLLILCSVKSTMYGNKEEGIIFAVGFSLFGITGLGELVWYYLSGQEYRLVLWKWGVLCFVISLIIIVGRRIARTHQQVLEYSKKLEHFNIELQRSEKMEIISDLAASVAHEVRNPLQVTRGFIQLLNENASGGQEKLYLNLALEELDRASGIISDFLTFAKPEVNKSKKLSIQHEFKHIESILSPMANLYGGQITTDIPESLYIMGSSSKFKQAFINIIKNSIESFQGEGNVRIWAYEEEGKVYIHVKDNGEGMTELELMRLGEPYFSNKTKGTGLGLMVTFRIIEVMDGEIHFTSEKGKGTEAVVRFPIAATKS